MKTFRSTPHQLRIRYLVLFIFCVCVGCNKKEPVTQADTHLAKIENGLIPTVQIENDPVYFRLLDRMKHYGAVGFSLTTIKDFEVEDSKGYGFCQKENSKVVKRSDHNIYS